jgi:hypothetical protein
MAAQILSSRDPFILLRSCCSAGGIILSNHSQYSRVAP